MEEKRKKTFEPADTKEITGGGFATESVENPPATKSKSVVTVTRLQNSPRNGVIKVRRKDTGKVVSLPAKAWPKPDAITPPLSFDIPESVLDSLDSGE